MCVRESLSLLELGNPFHRGGVRAIHDYQHFQNEQPEKLLNITFSSQEQVVHISLWNITSKSYKYQSKKNERTQQQGNLLRKWCFTPPTETVTGENYKNYKLPKLWTHNPQPPLKFGSKPAPGIYARNYTFHARSKENIFCLHYYRQNYVHKNRFEKDFAEVYPECLNNTCSNMPFEEKRVNICPGEMQQSTKSEKLGGGDIR